MPPKRQLSHLKEARKLAKQRKIEIKNDILKEDASFLFEDESIGGSWVSEKVITQYGNLDWEDDSDSEDDVEMTDDDEDIFDVDAFTKLMKAAQDSSNFESHKTPFLRGAHLSSQQKRRHAQHQRELASSAHGCQSLTAGFLITTSSEPDPSTSSLPSFELSPISPPILEQSNSSLVQYTSPKAKLHQERLDAIHELEKKIASKKLIF